MPGIWGISFKGLITYQEENAQSMRQKEREAKFVGWGGHLEPSECGSACMTHASARRPLAFFNFFFFNVELSGLKLSLNLCSYKPTYCAPLIISPWQRAGETNVSPSAGRSWSLFLCPPLPSPLPPPSPSLNSRVV